MSDRTKHKKQYIEMSTAELSAEYELLKKEYDSFCKMNLSLDLSRGKPNSDQLDISLPLLSEARPREKCFSINGVDCRNYGVLDGIPEMKKLFADMLGIDEKYVYICDGKERPVERPKRKNPKHVKKTGEQISDIMCSTDRALRKALSKEV